MTRPVVRGVALAVLIVAAGSPQAVRSAETTHPGVSHTLLLKRDLPDTPGLELIVWDTEYAPGAANPRHLHPAAVTFRVLSGTGIWQEDGNPPVTLHAGDTLSAPAGTIHAHWNPSATEKLRFLEFIVTTRDKERSIPQPQTN